MDEANKQQEKMVLFDSITGAIYGPNTNGVTGYVARAVAPEVSYQIGQYFKGNDFLNGLDGGNRNGEGSAPHILAHGILAAAVSAATGNDVTTGALSAMGAEAAAPMVAKFLFRTDDPSQLTAEQKATVSSITSLAGIGVGSTTGDVGSAVNAGETAKTTIDDNAVQALGAFCGPGAAVCISGISGALYLATPQGQENLKKGVRAVSDYSNKAYYSVKNAIFDSGPSTGNSDLDEVLKDATPTDSGDKGYEYPGTQQDLIDKIGNIDGAEVHDKGNGVVVIDLNDGTRVNTYPGRTSTGKPGWSVTKPGKKKPAIKGDTL
jgi:hypothetical protein